MSTISKPLIALLFCLGTVQTLYAGNNEMAATPPVESNAQVTSQPAARASIQALSQPLSTFSKIQVGPLINVVLQQGESEHIRLEYDGIAEDKLNYMVKGKTLHIYLDDARYTVKQETVINAGLSQKVPIYRGVTITAYVTYKALDEIQFRGEEHLSCSDSLQSDKFKLKVFGESEVTLAHLQSRRLKVHAYGENSISIKTGDASLQKFRLFGENRINTEYLAADRIKTNSFGESEMKLSSSHKLNVLSFGSMKMEYAGDPQFKRIVLGDANIDQK